MNPEDNNNNPYQPPTDDSSINETPDLNPTESPAESPAPSFEPAAEQPVVEEPVVSEPAVEPSTPEVPSTEPTSQNSSVSEPAPAPATQVSDVFSSSDTPTQSPEGLSTETDGSPEANSTSPEVGSTAVGTVGQTPESGKKNSKLVLILSIVAAVLLLGVGTAFAVQHFMGENDDTDTTTQEQVVNTDEDQNDNVEEEPVAPATSETAIDKTIVDEELGYTINASKLVIAPFDIPERYAAANEGKTVVLVEVTVSSEGTYTGAPGAASLRLIDASGRVVSSTSILDDTMKDAGYVPATISGPRAGESTTSHAAYMVDSDKVSDLTLQYNRAAATVIGGSGGNIPAKTFEVKLTD